VDIKFKESEGKKFNLKVDVLDKEHNRWMTMVTAESSLIDDNKYERFQAAQHFKTDTYRIIINSVFDTVTNHLYTQPKITQVRFFGLVPDEDIKKYKANITKDDVCPEGYGKDAESGLCVKSIPSQIIKPKTIDAHSSTDMGTQTPAGNDPENLLTVNPNDKLTLKGVGSTIEYGLARTDAISGVYIHKLNNPPRQYTVLVAFYNGQDKQPFYSFVVDIPDTQDKYVHILNQPLRADRFVLSVVDNTEPNQWFSLFGLYLIGEQNAGPEGPAEPPIPKSCSIKAGGWGSVSDKNPEEWTAVAMEKSAGKWKGIGKDKKNVFHMCDSKEDANAFITRKIWESKQAPPPVEPPVEPPTEPPVEPPTTGDGSSIALVYPAKTGGQVVAKTEYKRSTHNQSNQKNIPRDSFYSVPKDFFKASNAQIAGYFNVDFQREDELSFKILGGGHGDDNPEAGRCYAIGINIDPGKATVPHIAKEYPKHPTTPKFYDKAKLGEIKTPLQDLNRKTFGMRLNYWVTSKKTLAGRLDLDLSVLDKKVSDLKECPNKWQTFFTFEDDGSWTGEPYLENQGLKFKDIALGWYIRIDNIKAKTETAFLQGIETAPTGV
jgi:hypothetical protein